MIAWYNFFLVLAMQVPFGYCWSPSLVAKPKDWGDNIDITGYFLLKDDAMGEYTPPRELASFLAAGPAPVYLGRLHFVHGQVSGFQEPVWASSSNNV